MPGYVFLQEGKNDLVPQVSHASGIASLHECNRFPLIIRRLADTFLREEKYKDENRAMPKGKKSHFYLSRFFSVPAHYRPIRQGHLHVNLTRRLLHKTL